MNRVLVVDDNVDAAETLADLVALWGHEVATAHDGPAALEQAERFRPDVVLLDITMPGMDGYEVASRLRSDARSQISDLRGSGSEAGTGTPALVLVALTGHGDQDAQRRAREAGFDHHLTKPIDPEDIRRLLQG